MILGIDPGNEYTAFCLIDEADGYRPVCFDKVENHEAMQRMLEMQTQLSLQPDLIAIEMVESYGMPVGKEVFETCVWIGRFYEALMPAEIQYVYRHEEKMNICHSAKANDATIKQALVDRFAKGERNYGKGTKTHPGFFYGFKADIWAAFAVAVTCAEKLAE